MNITDRGYTGHEHLYHLALINMNGRMYDPFQGRFLSPDPYVQDPLNPLNHNRYAYCLNNPTKYTDPSGYQSENPASLSPDYGNNGSNFMSFPDFYSSGVNYSQDYYSPDARYSPKTFQSEYGTGANIPTFFSYSSGMGSNNVYNNSGNSANTYVSNQTSVNTFSIAYPTPNIEGVPLGLNAGQGRWYDNMGVYITGVALTVEDVYNNFGHNHTTYTTTGGVTKNIYKANGMLRSARAAQFATLSKAVSYAGTAGTALMTAQSGTKIYNGSASALDYSDFTVGTTGLIGAFSQLGGYTIPGIGGGVALYSWGRLWFDLGAQYGPSKWYGNDDTSWYK